MYALNLGPDGRVLSATLSQFAPEGQPRVEALPAGDLSEYRYGEDGFIHDPVKVEEPVLLAERNLEKGAFFSVGGNMFIATANIARGEALRPGRNCRETSIEEQIVYLYSRL